MPAAGHRHDQVGHRAGGAPGDPAWLRSARLGALLLGVWVGACGGGGAGEDAAAGPDCSAVAGLWHASIDAGNGLVARQDWTVTERRCDLQLVGDPADVNGLLPTRASGNAAHLNATASTGLWLSWVSQVGACQVAGSLDLLLDADDSLGGRLYWGRGANGLGFCPGGTGSLVVSATR
ncbi:MAG: hypothetical protein RIQ60_1468 [Pseudomonadota bacterium]|jgi:hypothetical protein